MLQFNFAQWWSDTILLALLHMTVVPPCFHTSFYTKYFQTVYHTMSIHSCGHSKTVSTTYLAHIYPELKCHKAQSWTVRSCSRQNCLQHQSYMASTLSSKVGGLCSAQADLVEMCIQSLLSRYCKTYWVQKQVFFTAVGIHIYFIICCYCYNFIF